LGPQLAARGGGMNDPQHQRPRGELEFSPADELTATLWCLAALLAVLLGANWLAAAIYS
jgi:hypothetical protein